MNTTGITNKFTDLQKAWLEALKTSKKCTGSLVGNQPPYDKFCCLGVAGITLSYSKIYISKRGEAALKCSPVGIFSNGLGTEDNPVYAEFGLLSPLGVIKNSIQIILSYEFITYGVPYFVSLSVLNDNSNLTHDQIRQIIEKYPGIFFSNFDTPDLSQLHVVSGNNGQLVFKEVK